MKTIFNLTEPRDEVLQCELRDVCRPSQRCHGRHGRSRLQRLESILQQYLPHRRPANAAASGVRVA